MKKLFRLSSAVVAALFVFTLVAPAAASAQVLINEFMAKPVEISAADGQWVELTNTATSPVSVDGWSINGVTITAPDPIPAGDQLVICSNSQTSVNGNVNCDVQAAINLDPSGQTLTLADETANTVDSFTYDGSDVQDDAATEVIQTDSGASFITNTTDSYGRGTGTPGTQNTSPNGTVRNTRTGVVYGSIQAAINAALSGDTLTAATGIYAEGNVVINTALTLNAVTGATINGQITINHANVTVNGFDITNPTGSFGILVSGKSDVSLTGNNLHNIGDQLATGSAQAIYVNAGSGTSLTNVTISGNTIDYIGSPNLAYSGVPGSGTSAKAIYVGDTTGSGSISGLTINGNSISNIFASTAAWNTGRGAYGVLINFGGSTTANITNNTITTLEGLWAHGVGLEGNTPGTVLTNNTITGLTDHKNGNDAHAIFFENNASKTSTILNGQTLSNLANVAVNTAWTDYDANPVVDLNGSTYIYGVNAFSTIQAGIDAVDIGGTVNVAAGSYAETISISKGLTVNGAGDSALTGTVIGLSGSGSLVNVLASNVTLQNLRIDRQGAGNSLNLGGSSLSQITLSGVTVTGAVGTVASPGTGIRVGTGTNIDGLTVSNSHFDGNDIGWYLAKESVNSSTVTNVTVTGTSFSNNSMKGLYAEKLEHASFDGISVANSGTNTNYAYNAGIDINLKWSSYNSISIINSSISNSGLTGSSTNPLFPAGITFKARDDGSYGSSAASLDQVTFDNIVVNGGVNGIRFGEPGKNNAGPTNVSLLHSSISGMTGQALINETTANISATPNWWGVDTQAGIVAKVSGLLVSQFIPWYINPGRTLLNTSLTGTTVNASNGDLDLPADTPGQAQLPTNTNTITFTNNTILNLLSNVKTTSAVSVNGRSVSSSQTIAGLPVVLSKQVTLSSGNSQPVTIKNNSAGVSNIAVEIPNNTTIYAPSGWDGTIKPPTAVTVAANETAPSGFSFGSTVLKVGSDTGTLVFDEVVTLTLPGVNTPVGYQAAGSSSWQLIATCGGDYANPVLPVFPGECSITNGTDTKILTFHFTTFAALTATPAVATTTKPAVAQTARRATSGTSTSAPTTAVAAVQAGTSSATTTNPADNTVAAIDSNGHFRWYYLLFAVSLLGVLYYLTESHISKKLK